MDGETISITKTLKFVIVSFYELRENYEILRMTRKFKNKERAETFIATLLQSGRKVSTIESKTVETYIKEEKNGETVSESTLLAVQ